LLHQIGDLFELNVKLWCQKVKTFSVGCPFNKSHTKINALLKQLHRIW